MGVTVKENTSDEICRPNLDPFDISPEWQMRAEKELNECPETARKNVAQLRQKLKDDLAMNSRLDDVFCMAFLRARKHDVDKAYKLVKSYYDMKKKFPEFYRYCYPSERSYLYDLCFLTLLPGEDRLGRMITALTVRNCDFSQMNLEDIFQLGTSAFEVALMDPKIQISGGVCLVDMKDMSIYQQAKLITPSAAWQITNCIQEKIPLRVKGIHIINQPFYFNALYSIFKPFLKSKLRKRIHLHGSNMESLHKHFSPSVLPEEFGGTRGPLNSKPLVKLVEQHEFRLRDHQALMTSPLMPNTLDTICEPRENPFDVSEEWLKRAEVEVHEDHAQAKINKDKLRKLLLNEPNLNPRTDDPFLLAFLRARKHDVDKAFRMVLQYYEMRLKYPKYYEISIPSERWHVYSRVPHSILEKRDSQGRSILILRGRNMNPSYLTAEEIFSALTTSAQFLMEDPKAQIAGIILIIDLAGYTLNHMRLLTPRNVWIVINALQDTFPVRTKAIHIVNNPFFFEALYNCFKPFLKEKFRKRIKIHGKNMKSLHAFVEPKALPEELGGEQSPYNNRSLCNQLNQNAAIVKEWSKYRYKKAK